MVEVKPLTAQEIEFISEDTYITVLPTFNLSKPLSFIRGDVGPWRAGAPVEVPLWLALAMRKVNRCKVQAPEWLDAGYLTKKVDMEKSEEQFFEEMPFHYIEVASQLLQVAKADIPECEKVRLLLEDIESIRAAKVRRGLHSLQPRATSSVKMNNLSAMEINNVRPFITEALDRFFLMHEGQEGNAQTDFASQNASQSQMDSNSQVEDVGPVRPLRRYR